MNFFSHQEQALRRTVLLVVLFFVAVAVLIGALNFFIAYVFFKNQNPNISLLDSVPAEQWFFLSFGTLAIIGFASFVRWLQLLDGGRAIAESLGGRRLSPDSKDFYERRLLNVVEEIALAACTPVPPVYVLDEESINAFAAGYKASDAVIGVTKGCMTQLSRDQLQGVIAHEFSHIFNGDMRLNIRLIAVLFGILFIGLIGRFLLDVARSSSSRGKKNDGAGAIMLVGLGLMIIGYCGVFFGNLIKSAVSRQREYLADASAVQFTRNPEGIAGALKVIGYGTGSYLHTPKAEEVSHLFFGQALNMHMFGLFDTHPPLDKRIFRIEPKWNGQFIPPQTRASAQTEMDSVATFTMPNTLAAVATLATIDIQKQSDSLLESARSPELAPALMCALLVSNQNTTFQTSALKLLANAPQQALFKSTQDLLTSIHGLSDSQRLPLVEIAMPALKQMTKTDYKAFRVILEQLMQIGKEASLFDWCLVRLIHGYLDAHFGSPNRKNDFLANSVNTDKKIGVLLSVIANHGHDETEDAQAAFLQGCAAGNFNNLTHYARIKAPDLGDSFTQLRNLMPHIKGRLLKAMYAVVRHDGVINTAESDLIRTIAAILEMPSVLDD